MQINRRKLVPVVFAFVLEVIHIAANMHVSTVVLLSLLSNAEVNEVTGVFHNKFSLLERSGCDDPATFARKLHHL